MSRSPSWLPEGIIPAYAGSTFLLGSWSAQAGDHPRVCGEHGLRPRGLDHQPGSSPRMRGALCRASRCGTARGIIPAYAGSTSEGNEKMSNYEDHPRVCGEHLLAQVVGLLLQGSSPRMRGAPIACRNLRGADGIIPAYAGSTRCSRSTAGLVRDHPRVCGEHPQSGLRPSFRGGSSPRMRGALVTTLNAFGLLRIIPAYAGSTPCHSFVFLHYEDHPRVCGEHCSWTRPAMCRAGSSPRMRGARMGAWRGVCLRRIIPAYAGSTVGGPGGILAARDHPRVCGEHSDP